MAAATVAKNLKDRRQRQALEEIFKKVNKIPVPCFWSPLPPIQFTLQTIFPLCIPKKYLAKPHF
jgi:hypothetical protein